MKLNAYEQKYKHLSAQFVFDDHCMKCQLKTLHSAALISSMKSRRQIPRLIYLKCRYNSCLLFNRVQDYIIVLEDGPLLKGSTNAPKISLLQPVSLARASSRLHQLPPSPSRDWQKSLGRTMLTSSNSSSSESNRENN